MDEFAEDFSNDVRPYVEKNYRVKADRSSRAIAGLSMGGAQTLNVAFDKLPDYGYIGVYSSGRPRHRRGPRRRRPQHPVGRRAQGDAG